MRRTWTLLIAAAVVAVLGIGGYALVQQYSEAEEPVAVAPVATATVVLTDLVERETFAGTLRFAEPTVVLAQAPGTVTALRDPGDVVERGDTLFEIDGTPVLLLYGDRPSWRPLTTDIPDGPDVLQLEENLAAIGFDQDGEMIVDQEFTQDTADAVAAWQDSLGRDDTGRVELGTFWYRPGPVRIGNLLVEVGSTVGPGVPVVETSSTEREVQVLLDADRQDLMAVGDSVGIELADGTATSGTVKEIGRVVAFLGTGPDAARVVEVSIVLDDPTVAGDVDQSPVDVEVVSDRASSVLAVPVNALLALAEGGYAVELTGPGGTRLVSVEIGTFADGLVEVNGDLAAGDTVMVPG